MCMPCAHGLARFSAWISNKAIGFATPSSGMYHSHKEEGHRIIIAVTMANNIDLFRQPGLLDLGRAPPQLFGPHPELVRRTERLRPAGHADGAAIGPVPFGSVRQLDVQLLHACALSDTSYGPCCGGACNHASV